LNSSLTASWQQLIDKFNALNTRERSMIFAALLCVLYGLFDFLIAPTLAKQKLINTEIANGQAKLEAFNLELLALTKNSAQTESPEQQKIKQLQHELQSLESTVSDLKSSLVSPEKMPDLLSDLLRKNADLKLVALKTLPTKAMFEQKEAVAQSTPTIFKHGVEMTIEGRYLDLLSYVAMVEKMPWHVLMDHANLVVDNQNGSETPVSQLTMTVYTLGLDKTWLSI
jgi:MSHA biogenesis protein MshJ